MNPWALQTCLEKAQQHLLIRQNAGLRRPSPHTQGTLAYATSTTWGLVHVRVWLPPAPLPRGEAREDSGLIFTLSAWNIV